MNRSAVITSAPQFWLPDVITGRTTCLEDFNDKKAFLVAFICRHCPYVQHIKKELAQLGRDYADKSLGIVAISSNDAEVYKEDHPDRLSDMALEEGFTFPLLYDESQQAAKVFTAVATPEFFLFNKNRELVYRGQMDDSRPASKIPVTGKDLREAIEAVLNDRPVAANQKPAVGCSIKWKPGNEP